MSSIGPNEHVLKLKCVRERDVELKHPEKYVELPVSSGKWGRVFVLKRDVEELGGSEKIVGIVNERLPVIFANSEVQNVKIRLNEEEYRLLHQMDEEAVAGSSLEEPARSERVNRSTFLLALCEEKRGALTEEFLKFENRAYFGLASVQKLINTLDRESLVMSGVDELVARIKRELLVERCVEEMSPADREMIRSVVFEQIQDSQLNVSPKDVKNFAKINGFYTELGQLITKKVNRRKHFLKRRGASGEASEGVKPTSKMKPGIGLEQMVRYKKNLVLEELGEKTEVRSPRYEGFRRFVIRNLSKRDIVMSSVDALKEMVNDQIKKIREIDQRVIRLGESSEVKQRGSSSVSRRERARLMFSLAEKRFTFDFSRFWYASKQTLKMIINDKLFPHAAKEYQMEIVWIASHLDSLIQSLPNDQIKNLSDLKRALKEVLKAESIRNESVKTKHFDRETFANIVAGRIPIDLSKAPEYASAKEAFEKGLWGETEEKTFTFNLLEFFIGSRGIVDAFFSFREVRLVLNRNFFKEPRVRDFTSH